MKNYLFYFLFLITSLLFFSCINYKRNITDEVFLKNGNTETGTIIKADSNSLRIKKVDESQLSINWNIIDSVNGKKFKTLWLGANFGTYNTPYFSVFRNQSYMSSAGGFQLKIGLAYRGAKLYYIDFFHTPTKPYAVNKFGLGFQRYVFGNYLKKRHSFFVGSEFNAMSIRYNNGPQFAYEPFTGYEVKLNEHIRLNARFGLQINLFNKNNQTGANLSVGIHFMKRNFKKYYDYLNKEHRVYHK